jgi:2-polyprenyl-3-methyl-5-hydroxy-6-metoxy-1,4-benzoquinol methylase
MTKEFYETMTPLYHLLYAGWEQSMERQAAQLDKLIQENWGNDVRTILDVSCGIGTQALGLARLNYQVTASDLSEAAVERANQEAQKRGVEITFSVADMHQAYQHHQQQVEVVISYDNAVPHLLSEADIRQAFGQFYDCLRPGGGSSSRSEIMKKRSDGPRLSRRGSGSRTEPAMSFCRSRL